MYPRNEALVINDGDMCIDCRQIDFKSIVKYIQCCKKHDAPEPLEIIIQLNSLRSMRERPFCRICHTIVQLAEASWDNEFDTGRIIAESRSQYRRQCWVAAFGPVTGRVSLEAEWFPILRIFGSHWARKGSGNASSSYFGQFLLDKPSLSFRVSQRVSAAFAKEKGPAFHTSSSLENEPGILRPPSIDIQAVYSWLKGCERSHKKEGVTLRSEGEHQAVDIILIDVWGRKLVNRTTRERYYALSYVWGGIQMLRTVKANRKKLENEGALGGPDFSIPGIICEAMGLVRALGDDYLWVDSLCICQDDEDQKHAQITQMDVIYSRAYLTLAATIGDCASSTSMVGRPQSFPTLQIRGIQLVPRPRRFISDLLTGSKYESRAWTFQERLLSPRCLLFTEHGLLFFCQNCKLRTEDRPRGEWNDRVLEEKLGFFEILRDNKWEDESYGNFLYYRQLVSDYTNRTLSYPSDILDAFSGLAAAIGNSFNDHFVYGLPQSILDFSLLWCPAESASTRRAVDGKCPFPTWSWAGWHGRIEYDTVKTLFTPSIDDKVFEKFTSLIREFFLEESGEIRPLPRNGALYSITETSRSREQPPRRPLDLGRPVLHFTATALPASRFSFETIRSAPLNHLMVGATTAGNMLSFDETVREQLRDPGFEFIALSSFRRYQGGSSSGSYMIMLVERKGSYYERVAIGHVDVDIWRSQSPEEKDISLA